MRAKVRDVRSYLDALEETKEGKTDQVREGLETYIGLWKKAVENGVISESDPIDSALGKIERKGGLYKAAE